MPSDVRSGQAEILPEEDPELLSHLFALVKRYRQLERPARVTYEVNGVRVTLEEPFLGGIRDDSAPRD